MNQVPRSTWIHSTIAMILVIVLIALVAGPLTLFFLGLWPDAAATLRTTLADSTLTDSLLQTLWVGFAAAIVAALIALPAALLIAHLDNPLARAGMLFIGLSPLAMPAFVTAFVLQHAIRQLNSAGVNLTLDRELQLVIVYALHYLPLILLSLVAALQRMNLAHQESARNLGAGAFTVWRTITLPQMIQPFLLGTLVLVLRVIEDVGAPLVIGMHEMLAPTLLSLHGTTPDATLALRAWALITIALTASLVLLGWTALLPAHDRPSAHSSRRPTRPTHPWIRGALRIPVVAALLILALSPYLWLLLMSTGTWSGAFLPESLALNGFQQLLDTPPPALGKTVLFAGAGGLITLTFGTALVFVLLADGWPGVLIRHASTAMFAIPGVVFAIACWHLPIAQNLTWPGKDVAWLTLACIVALKLLPVIAHLIVPQIPHLSRAQKDSAYNLGCGKTGVAVRFGIPVLAVPLLLICLIGGAGTLLELSIALTLLTQPDVSLAIVVYEQLQSAATATTGAAWALLIALIALTVFWLVARRLWPLRPFADDNTMVKTHG